MKSRIRYVFFCTILVFSWGCAQKSAKLQKNIIPPDKTLFETGSEYLRKSQYIKARLTFQNLIMTYPDSEMAAESYFAIGDSFYEEGGTENLLQAENQFKDFIIFYPAHPKAPDALMKVISVNIRSMGAPDRDQHYAYKARQVIKSFLQQFPDNDFVPIVKQYEADVEESLARGDYLVGKFYEDRGNLAGANGRYKEITDNYSNYSDMPEVYFRLAGIMEKANNPDEASIYYGKVVSEYPFSKRSEESKARLVALGKPVPMVNTKLAAENQAKIRPPEGFSPLKPFIDFGKALGFVAPPDKYAEAKRIIEAEKAKVAETAGKRAETEQGAADDIQIETIIRKSASGETRDTTILKETPGTADPDKDADKKEDQKNKKRYSKKPS
ncbi:MAG: outer membrane protein assembly factor BamD [Acidobacteria bacterium]|nr:outer membrane protein assembly factor BamD [Acidobacteriota bacterium]